VRPVPSGSNYEKCKANVMQALNLNATCYVKNCTFNGVWNGGGGAGLHKLYLARGFYDAGHDVSYILSKDL
jgi:apyrase